MTHTLDKELHMYIDKLNNEQKESLLAIIQSFFVKGSVCVDQYNQEIDSAMLRMENEDYINHDDVEKQAKEW